ncbi:MAG TPA: class I SAM-dependent methyltransferase [Longimicrobiales bacterium]|nr:class I SAM-dependent methyltransferase [Longimicrobiales bacterium]
MLAYQTREAGYCLPTLAPIHVVLPERLTMDPLAGTNWSAPGTVRGFAQSAPNAVLMRFAEGEVRRCGHGHALDLGCGAGRNAVPLAGAGWNVLGLDLSWPMLLAAADRGAAAGLSDRLAWALSPMEQIPARDRSFDLIVAHGIWNLATSSRIFRRGVEEAARVARPGAGLFVFTFSRNTFPTDTAPVPGEPFVFTQFSGEPQCFLTEEQLIQEMARVGFVIDPAVPMTEYNRPSPAVARLGGPPVILEAAFRFRGRDG